MGIICVGIGFLTFWQPEHSSSQASLANHNWSTHEIIFILDDSEKLDKNSFLPENDDFLGAMTCRALAALTQQAAPLVMSKTLTRTCLLLPHLLEKSKTGMSEKVLAKRYHLSTNTGFNLEKLKKAYHFPDRQIHPYHYAGLAARVTFNYDEWIIRQINQELYLFIPKTYKPASAEYRQSNDSTATKWTEQEKTLGIQVDHMRPVQYKDLENLLRTPPEKLKEFAPFFNPKEIFVPHSAYQQRKKIPRWSIYFTGHGWMLSPSIPQIQQNINDVYNLWDSTKDIPTLRKKITTITNTLHKHLSYDARIDILDQILDLLKEDTPQAYEQAAQIWETSTNLQSLLTSLSTPTQIAGLPVDQFIKFLTFCNNKIYTKFFYYATCFAGGKNLEEMFKHQRNFIKHTIFNYYIMARSITDAPTYNITPQFVHGKLQFDQNYQDFFNHLRNFGRDSQQGQDDKFLLAIAEAASYYRSFDQPEKIANIPQIRIPGSASFTTTANYDDHVYEIDNNQEQPYIIEPTQGFLTPVLLHPRYLTTPLIVKTAYPRFVSMIAGNGYHIIEQFQANITIHHLARAFLTEDTADAFLFFEDLATQKLFWIKEAELADGTYHDIILTYNISPPIKHKTHATRFMYATKNKKGVLAHYHSENDTDLADTKNNLTNLQSIDTKVYTQYFKNYLQKKM